MLRGGIQIDEGQLVRSSPRQKWLVVLLTALVVLGVAGLRGPMSPRGGNSRAVAADPQGKLNAIADREPVAVTYLASEPEGKQDKVDLFDESKIAGPAAKSTSVVTELNSLESVKAEYLEALARLKFDRQKLKRQQALFRNGAVKQVDVDDAQAAVDAVLEAVARLERALRGHGLSDEQIKELYHEADRQSQTKRQLFEAMGRLAFDRYTLKRANEPNVRPTVDDQLRAEVQQQITIDERELDQLEREVRAAGVSLAEIETIREDGDDAVSQRIGILQNSRENKLQAMREFVLAIARDQAEIEALNRRTEQGEIQDDQVLKQRLARHTEDGKRTARLLLVLGVSREELAKMQVELEPEVRKISRQFPQGVAEAKAQARQAMSINNLKQIALALHNYVDKKGAFPTDIFDANGKPLLSWRIQILPYLEATPSGEGLYREFHLDEPWDSAHNKPLAAKMPAVFRTPLLDANSPERAIAYADDPTMTGYLSITGPDTVFGNPKGTKMRQIIDGTANTAMVVEGQPLVPWTQPGGIGLGDGSPEELKKLAVSWGGYMPDSVLVLFADGAVHTLKREIEPSALKAIFMKNDRQQVKVSALEY